MEVKDLSLEEQVRITGGSEASDALCYYAGVGAHYLCKALYWLAEGAQVAAKCN